MKRLKQTVMAVAMVVSPLVAGPIASAVSTCPTDYTGPDSKNICTSTTSYQCTKTNDNTVTITNNGTQVAVSGDATAGGNGSAGSAQSGFTTNSNGVTFTATVTNGGVCTATATVPATPEAPTVPAAPAASTKAPVKKAVPAPQKAMPPVLADTSGDTTPTVVGGAAAGIIMLTIASRLVLGMYSRRRNV